MTVEAESAVATYDARIRLEAPLRVEALPLADEPHIAAWEEYARDAVAEGTIPALKTRLVQLHFPVRAGISKTDPYLAATRRGVFPVEAETPEFSGPITLRVEQTIAGRVPIVVAEERRDFETLVQIFGSRNEPEPVPASMGACIITGLNDWDRVRVHREAWIREHDEASWPDEFSRLAKRKELYQDRFIILSTGPYSGVPAPAGVERWLETSLAIRREHESTHYLTYRLTGTMRNHLLDELIADYAALVRVFGSYRDDLARLFFGLEAFPEYRSGGRMENYRGNPPFPDEAIPAIAELLHGAIGSLSRFDVARRERFTGDVALSRIAALLATKTLTEIAGERFVDAFAAMVHDHAS